MNRLLPSLVSMFVATVLAGCAGSPLDGKNSLVLQIDDIATGPSQTRPAVLEVDGKPMVLYSTKAGQVALQHYDKVTLLEETARVKTGGSYFQLSRQASNVQALWWSHQDGKNIYLASSQDAGKTFAPVSMVNDDHGVLPPFWLTYGSEGTIGLIYSDERYPNYQAYFNRSTDVGKTWNRPDVRLDALPEGGRSSDVHEPNIIQLGNVWLTAWTDKAFANGQTSYRIVARRSTDSGVSWLPQQVVFQSDRHISSFVLRSYGDAIVGVADEINKGVFALMSSDKGVTWTNLGSIEGTAGGNNSGIEIAEALGRVNLVWMRDEADKKGRILRASLDLQTAKWVGAAERVDVKDFENTRSISPVIINDAKGRLVTAWVDYRDIRPNIYLSSSNDRGQTWSKAEPLLKQGQMAAGWPTLFPWGGDIALAYETYPTDVLAQGKFNVRLLAFAEDGRSLQGMAKQNQVSESARKARLEERVKQLWASRVAGDYETAYDLFDFAYKAATPKKIYLANAGVITYLQFSIDTVSISGNEANVATKVKYEVKPTAMPFTGKPITLAPFDSDTPTRWVWVENDWYVVYTPSFDPPTLKY